MTFFGFLPVALETMKMLQDNLLNKSLGVDTVCVTGGSVRFPVHSFVLASGSETLAKQIKFAETLGPTVLDFQVGLSFSGFLSGFFLSLYLSHTQTDSFMLSCCSETFTDQVCRDSRTHRARLSGTILSLFLFKDFFCLSISHTYTQAESFMLSFCSKTIADQVC